MEALVIFGLLIFLERLTAPRWGMPDGMTYAFAMLLPFAAIAVIFGPVAATIALGICWVACFISGQTPKR